MALGYEHFKKVISEQHDLVMDVTEAALRHAAEHGYEIDELGEEAMSKTIRDMVFGGMGIRPDSPSLIPSLVESFRVKEPKTPSANTADFQSALGNFATLPQPTQITGTYSACGCQSETRGGVTTQTRCGRPDCIREPAPKDDHDTSADVYHALDEIRSELRYYGSRIPEYTTREQLEEAHAQRAYALAIVTRVAIAVVVCAALVVGGALWGA